MFKRSSLVLVSFLAVANACEAQNNSVAGSMALPSPTPNEMPAPIPAQDRFSLSQALDLGLKNNPQVAAAAYSVVSARENFNSQKAPLNPTVNYAALNNTVAPLTFSTGFSQSANYSAYVTIETNGAILYRAWQAREQYHQAQFDARTTVLSLKLSIIGAYEGLQVANRTLEVELKVYDNMVKLSDLTDKRFEVGAGPQADAIRAHIAAIQEQENVIADVANVNLARATLNNQLGRPQNAPVDAAEPLVYAPVHFEELAQLTKQGELKRPELKSANANLQSLRAVPGLQRSAYFPNIIVGKDFSSDDTIYVGLSIPVDLGGIRGSVAKANADIKTQRAQVELERQSIDLDVKSSYENFVAAQKQVDTYNGGILKMSETLVDQIRHGYDLGANTIVDIITAENTYRSVESSYYSAVGSYVLAAYTLKHSIGELLDTKFPSPFEELQGSARTAFDSPDKK